MSSSRGRRPTRNCAGVLSKTSNRRWPSRVSTRLGRHSRRHARACVRSDRVTVARSTDGRLLTQAVEALFDPGSAAAGGSAAAIAAALAATVLANIARSGGDHGRAAQGAALGMRLARLAGGDAQVLAVARALLENAAEGGNATRDFDLGRALDEAVSAP